MMKKLKVFIVAGAIVAAAIVLVVVVKCKTQGTEFMSRREADRRVQELKQKIKLPDEAMREKIDSLINDIREDHKFVEVNGQKEAISTVAVWELRKIGEPAIPQLIDAAVTHNDVPGRQWALNIIHHFYEERGAKAMEYLPVFVRSMYDKDPNVRGTAVAQIVDMARRFHRRKQQKELEQVITYLIKALDDENEGVRTFAGGVLYSIGRKELVPEELIRKHRMREGWGR